MIENEQQYSTTKAEAEKFRAAILADRERPVHLCKIDPLLRRAIIDGMQSQLDDLNQQLEEYERHR